MGNSSTINRQDDYITHLAELILQSNYTSKDELKELIQSHFAIMLLEKERPANEAIKKRYDELVSYHFELQKTRNPKCNKVAQEIMVVRKELKDSNRAIYNAQELNRIVNLKRYIRNRFGDEWLKDYKQYENTIIELKNK